eukprot:COSAG03_NODE_3980_length_1732_cov_6.675444_2_plen_177_part_00
MYQHSRRQWGVRSAQRIHTAAHTGGVLSPVSLPLCLPVCACLAAFLSLFSLVHRAEKEPRRQRILRLSVCVSVALQPCAECSAKVGAQLPLPSEEISVAVSLCRCVFRGGAAQQLGTAAGQRSIAIRPTHHLSLSLSLSASASASASASPSLSVLSRASRPQLHSRSVYSLSEHAS